MTRTLSWVHSRIHTAKIKFILVIRKKTQKARYNKYCIPESFNTDISLFVYSLQENTNSKVNFVFKTSLNVRLKDFWYTKQSAQISTHTHYTP